MERIKPIYRRIVPKSVREDFYAFRRYIEFKSAIGFKNDGVVDFESAGINCKFWVGNTRHFTETVSRIYEVEERKNFLVSLRSDDIVWDVGAAFGGYAIPAAKMARMVIAFEPDNKTQKVLKKNIELNGADNIIICPTVLDSKFGYATLNTDGDTGIAPSMGGENRFKGNDQTVLALTGDDLVEYKEDFRPNVIKIDVEGAELMVLKGMDSILSDDKRPRLLVVEIHNDFIRSDFGYDPGDIYTYLIGKDYVVDSSKSTVRGGDNIVHFVSNPQS